MSDDGAGRWADATLAAALVAIDPPGLGGIALRALPGPVREHWLAIARDLHGRPLRRLPCHVAEGRLLGGLDLAATLRAGRPVAERGLLAEADGGVLLLAMAERLEPSVTGPVTRALDEGELIVERDGMTARHPARIGVVALDEGGEDEGPPAALLDRLAFRLDLHPIARGDLGPAASARDEVEAARARLPVTGAGDEVVEALVGAASALGIGSLRAALFAVRAARAAAALAGRDEVAAEDAAVAARLVLAPRATALPAPPEPEDAEPEPPPHEAGPEPPDDDGRQPEEKPLEERVLEAAAAALPPDLLQRLELARARGVRAGAAGRAGVARRSRLRGRRIGVRRGALDRGARLDLIETLRAAAPWQPLRRRADACGRSGLRIHPDDFRIARFKERAQTTAIFVVDASGSSALHRLAEAKGAVELLLAACYVRRDQVALLAFRGAGAELLLPPTRSLARARRSLAGLPGGGGTPLAAGIDAALALAEMAVRKGETPVVVFLTDGRANVARDGTPGRSKAAEDALDAARRLAAGRVTALLVDTSPRPQAAARALAAAMGGRYLPLPQADAAALSGAVQGMMAPGAAATG